MPTNFPTILDNYSNPTSSDNLNTPGVIHHVQHANHNDAIEALEAKLGIDFSNVVNSIDFITTMLLMTQTEHHQAGYRELIPFGNPFPTNVAWYKDNTKTIKLVEKSYTYDSKKRITQVQLKIYDGSVSNILKRTITDTKTFQGGTPFETTRTRVVT